MPWVRVPSLYLLLLPFTLCLLSSPPGLAKEASPGLPETAGVVSPGARASRARFSRGSRCARLFHVRCSAVDTRGFHAGH